MAFVRYTGHCPRCKKIAELITTVIRAKLNIVEIKQREITKKMVRDLLGEKTPLIKFPATSRPEVNCNHCNLKEKIWGWTSQIGDKIIISFPRQTFFLAKDEFVDTVAHEPTHFLVNIMENNPLPKHGKKWYFQYRKNRDQLFEKYQKFINSSESLPIKYHKSYG